MSVKVHPLTICTPIGKFQFTDFLHLNYLSNRVCRSYRQIAANVCVSSF